MKAAYVDTSCLVAVAFGERGGAEMERRLAGYDDLFSSNLLEAELRAAFGREGVKLDGAVLERITWVLPDRPLSGEIRQVVASGYLRGANPWHLACALYLSEDPTRIAFLTLDPRQRAVADRIGFLA